MPFAGCRDRVPAGIQGQSPWPPEASRASHGRVAGAGDNVQLLLTGEVDELDRVAGDADGEVGVLLLLRMLHGVDELLAAEDVDVQMVGGGLEVAVQQLHQVFDALIGGLAEGIGIDGLGDGDAVQRPGIGELGGGVEGGDEAVLLCAVGGVAAGGEGSTFLAAVGGCAGGLAVHHVGGDGQDRGRGLGIAVGVLLLDHLDEGLQQPLGDVVSAVVVVAVLGEVADRFKAGHHAVVLVADGADAGVLQRADGVHTVGEACDAGGEGAAHVGVDQRHLSGLVVVLVVHVVDQVQGVDIQAGQPVQHTDVGGLDLVPGQVFAGDGTVGRGYLLAALLVDAAVDGIQQRLEQVRAGAEELDLLAGLGGGDAAADAVVVAPHGLHYLVVLILHGGGGDGDVRAVAAEGLGHVAGVEDGHVGLGRGAHVFQRVQEAEVVLGDQGTAVQARAAHSQRGPYGVAGEELLIALDAGELDHAELHDHMVDQLLGFGLGDQAVLQVALDVDVQERGDAAHGHGGAVLRLDGGQVAEVQPLEGLLGVGGGLGDVKAVLGGHHLHVLQGVDLLGDLLPLPDDLVHHDAGAAVGEVLLLFGDQHVDAVEGHAAVVAHNAAAAIGIRQAGDNVALAGGAHFRRVGLEHRIGVGEVIFGEDALQLRVGLVAGLLAAVDGHADAAEGHKGALEGLVRLQADDLLQVLQLLGNIAGAVGGQGRYDMGVHIQHAALGTLLLLKLLKGAPELVRRLGGPGQEGFIPGVGGIVMLDEITDIDFFLPEEAIEAIPLLKIVHWQCLLRRSVGCEGTLIPLQYLLMGQKQKLGKGSSAESILSQDVV